MRRQSKAVKRKEGSNGAAAIRTGAATRGLHESATLVTCSGLQNDLGRKIPRRKREEAQTQEKPLGEAAFPYERNEENEGLYFLKSLRDEFIVKK